MATITRGARCRPICLHVGYYGPRVMTLILSGQLSYFLVVRLYAVCIQRGGKDTISNLHSSFLRDLLHCILFIYFAFKLQ